MPVKIVPRNILRNTLLPLALGQTLAINKGGNNMRNLFIIPLLLAGMLLIGTLAIARDVITPSDFTFIGGFTTPSINEESPAGLTIRYLDGTPYLYTIVTRKDMNGAVSYRDFIEMAIPTLSTTYSSFPRATVRNDFNDIHQNTLRNIISTGGGTDCTIASPCLGTAATGPQGIYWDEVDQRLYSVHTADYNNTTTHSDTNFGYSTLNDTTHTGTGVASWRLSPPYIAGNGYWGGRWAHSIVPIPANISTLLGGRRIGIAGGRGVSIVSNGPPSLGPSMFAVKPPDTGVDTPYDYLSTPPTPLAHHLEGIAPRAKLPAGRSCRNFAESFSGSLVYDQWVQNDATSSVVWISEANKQGVLFLGELGGGNLDTTITAVNSPTSITLSNAGDTIPGDLLRIIKAGSSGYDYERRHVLSVSGNTIVFETALTDTYVAGDKVQGGIWYFGGGPENTRRYSSAIIYSEDDYLAVANGTKNPQDLIPSYNDVWEWDAGASHILRGRTVGTSPLTIAGATYDPTAKRLYVMRGRVDDMQDAKDIYVYQLNDVGSPTPTPGTSITITTGGTISITPAVTGGASIGVVQ